VVDGHFASKMSKRSTTHSAEEKKTKASRPIIGSFCYLFPADGSGGGLLLSNHPPHPKARKIEKSPKLMKKRLTLGSFL
jgi:hypothetical protein